MYSQSILGGGDMLADWALVSNVVDVFLGVLHDCDLSQVLVPAECALEVHFVFALLVKSGHHVDELLLNTLLA